MTDQSKGPRRNRHRAANLFAHSLDARPALHFTYFKGKREAALETLVRITFGTFMGGDAIALQPNSPIEAGNSSKADADDLVVAAPPCT